jgi:hypothetical protein
MDKTLHQQINSILLNRVLDITDKYKGEKINSGIQVYSGSPQQIIDEIEQAFLQAVERAKPDIHVPVPKIDMKADKFEKQCERATGHNIAIGEYQKNLKREIGGGE